MDVERALNSYRIFSMLSGKNFILKTEQMFAMMFRRR